MHAVDGAVTLVDRPARQVPTQQTPPVLQRSAVADNLLARVFEILKKFPGATELVFNRPGEVMVEHGATWVTVEDRTLTLNWVQGLATVVGRFTNQQINASRPIMSATLPGGERLQIVLPPAVEPGFASLTIRIPAPFIRSMEDYRGDGYFERFAWAFNQEQFARRRNELDRSDVAMIEALQGRDLVQFLTLAVRSKKNIAVVGATGTGKTTLMKTLCQSIPLHERLVTIEDVRELFLPKHQNRTHLLYSTTKGQGQAGLTPADMIASCMRMKPDRALLAELRGPEAYDFLDLLTTGHAGSITSFHAGSCALAFERYAMMAKRHPDAATADLREIHRLVELTIDVVVHVVAEVVEKEDDEDEKVRYVRQVHFDPLSKLDSSIARGATLQMPAGDTAA